MKIKIKNDKKLKQKFFEDFEMFKWPPDMIFFLASH